MALSVSQTAALGTILKPGMRVASLGYPDIIAEITPMDGLTYRADSEAICKRHGLRQRQIPDAHSFLEAHGCKLDVYDVVAERGCEIICDLNEVGMGISYTRGGIWACYDIVLDVGTLEHCYNIGQALINMAGMVGHGGYIIHENPFNCGNHGFYSINPTLYADFYAANGFEIVELCLANREGAKAPAPHVTRFKFTEVEANTFCMARRVNVQKFVFPVQSKYANSIPAAGVKGDKEIENA